MTIGVFAKTAGVGLETVRYYQRLGLLPTPRKPQSGARLYTGEMLDRMAFIRKAQVMSFTLEEIRRLVSMPIDDCAAAKALAQDKLQYLDERVKQLNDNRRKLRSVVASSKATKPGVMCPLLVMLNGQN